VAAATSGAGFHGTAQARFLQHRRHSWKPAWDAAVVMLVLAHAPRLIIVAMPSQQTSERCSLKFISMALTTYLSLPTMMPLRLHTACRLLKLQPQTSQRRKERAPHESSKSFLLDRICEAIPCSATEIHPRCHGRLRHHGSSPGDGRLWPKASICIVSLHPSLPHIRSWRLPPCMV